MVPPHAGRSQGRPRNSPRDQTEPARLLAKAVADMGTGAQFDDRATDPGSTFLQGTTERARFA